jgi:tRNA dimethylallyltransferase
MNKVIFVAGPTASGKSSRAVQLALEQNGEIISVDSRQVYRGLDIGTEKVSKEEMQGIPHHLIDIRDPQDSYSAGNFVEDATELIGQIQSQGKTVILAGGTHFYFDALLHGLPAVEPDQELRLDLEQYSNEQLLEMIRAQDPDRADKIEQNNRRRLVRALEIIRAHGSVPSRLAREFPYDIEWIVIDPDRDELRERIDIRLQQALDRGLIEEVRQVREMVGDARLNELGLEYRVVGEFLRGERTETSLLSTLSSKLWHYARRQKAWLRKLRDEYEATGA